MNNIVNYYRRNRSDFYGLIQFIKQANKKELKELTSLIQNQKVKGDNTGQWAYYLSNTHHIEVLINLVKKYKIKSILDLGCGAGHLMSMFSALDIQCEGIEIEPVLVKLANQSGHNVRQGDITEPFDQKYANAVYFYEPMFDSKLQEKFIKNLEQTLDIGTYVFYAQAGTTREYLEESTCFRRINKNGDQSIITYKTIK